MEQATLETLQPARRHAPAKTASFSAILRESTGTRRARDHGIGQFEGLHQIENGGARGDSCA